MMLEYAAEWKCRMSFPIGFRCYFCWMILQWQWLNWNVDDRESLHTIFLVVFSFTIFSNRRVFEVIWIWMRVSSSSPSKHFSYTEPFSKMNAFHSTTVECWYLISFQFDIDDIRLLWSNFGLESTESVLFQSDHFMTFSTPLQIWLAKMPHPTISEERIKYLPLFNYQNGLWLW